MEWIPQNPNEWLISDEKFQKKKANLEFKHSVLIEFSSDIYGTFRQTVAFDFGAEPLMVKHLCVDVRPASFATNVEELKKVCSSKNIFLLCLKNLEYIIIFF